MGNLHVNGHLRVNLHVNSHVNRKESVSLMKGILHPKDMGKYHGIPRKILALPHVPGFRTAVPLISAEKGNELDLFGLHDGQGDDGHLKYWIQG